MSVAIKPVRLNQFWGKQYKKKLPDTCFFNCVCVCHSRGLLHNSWLPITATRWARSIQRLPSIIQPAYLTAGRGESTSSGLPSPLPLLSAVRSLTESPNRKTMARDSREEEGDTGRRRGREDLQRPRDPVSSLLPLNAPRSHPQAQSQPPE